MLYKLGQSARGAVMSEEKSLFQLKRFKLAIIVPAMISLIVAVYIFKTSNIHYYPGYKGINNALTIFQVPLTLLALILPLVALAASSHRSEQTKKQIIVSQSQNTFSNYYKHVEEFYKLLDRLPSICDFDPKRKSLLYSLFFPKNNPSEFSPYYDISDGGNIVIAHEEINNQIKRLNESSAESSTARISIYKELFQALAHACLITGFSPKIEGKNSVAIFPRPFASSVNVYFSENDPFMHLALFNRYINEVRFFCQLDSVSYTFSYNVEEKNILYMRLLDLNYTF